MFEKPTIAVVIPTYRAQNHILEVIAGIPEIVNHIIIVDDKCPEKSGQLVESLMPDVLHRITLVYHTFNQGVGGAMITGYKKALEMNSDIILKMDSDGQMDPKYIPYLIEPIIKNKAGYAKGNRFVDFKALREMPRLRLLGNSALSFLVKACSGYWNIMDPTNGFTAISRTTLDKINLDKISKRYFFESDMLINLNIHNTIIKDVPIPAFYGNEKSSLSISHSLFKFPSLLLKGLIKRFVFKYLIYDFNMVSVYIITGMPLLLWGLFFGVYKWVENALLDVITSTGTVMLSVLPLILGAQFIIAAINIDINSTPGRTTNTDQ